MKPFQKYTGRMAALLLMVASPCVAGPGAGDNPYGMIAVRNPFDLQPPPGPVQDVVTAPSDILLTGISTIFDRKFALLKTREKSYLLAEGQRDGEVELLSVDLKAFTAKIRNHGMVQTVTLRKAPEVPYVPAGGDPVLKSEKDSGSVVGNGQEGASENPASGNESFVRSAFGVVTSNGDPSSDSDGGSAGLSNSSSEGNPDDGSGAQVYQYWRKGAEQIERARLATAQQVLEGAWQPYPLTPLTPPGTPTQLIGSDSMFMDHGPGVIIANR